MTILEFLNKRYYENTVKKIEFLESKNAPKAMVDIYKRKLEAVDKGKSFYNFGHNTPKERLSEEFESIKIMKGPRGGEYTIINNKYKLGYIKKFHIDVLDEVDISKLKEVN